MKKTTIILSYFFVFLVKFSLNSAVLYLTNDTNKDLYIKEFELANCCIENTNIFYDIIINNRSSKIANGLRTNNFLLNPLQTSFYKLKKKSEITIKFKDNTSYYLAISAECKIDSRSTIFNTKIYLIINSRNYSNKKELLTFVTNNFGVSGSVKFLDQHLFKGTISAAIYSDVKDEYPDQYYYFVPNKL